VPIVPGLPPAQPPVPIVPAAEPKRRWLVPVIALAAVASLALAGAGFWWLRDAAGIGQTRLRAAYEACNQVGRLADGDATLLLDLHGTDYGSGTVQPEDLRCYVRELPIPTYVVSRMEKTRALDGQVTQEWDGFEASWTYHPDNGLDVLIREV